MVRYTFISEALFERDGSPALLEYKHLLTLEVAHGARASCNPSLRDSGSVPRQYGFPFIYRAAQSCHKRDPACERFVESQSHPRLLCRRRFVVP